MGEEGERIAINARFRDKKYYRKHEGMMVSFVLADAARTVVAYVVTRDSPAKKEGKEVIFQVSGLQRSLRSRTKYRPEQRDESVELKCSPGKKRTRRNRGAKVKRWVP
jgi:hypothetical protein